MRKPTNLKRPARPKSKVIQGKNSKVQIKKPKLREGAEAERACVEQDLQCCLARPSKTEGE